MTTLVGETNSPDINGSVSGTDTHTAMEQIIENCVPTGGTINFSDNSDSVVGTDTEFPVVKVTGHSDSVRIEIAFITGTRGRFIVNKRIKDKVSSLYVYVSSELTGGRYRYVYFKSRYGYRELFRNFVVDQLKQCVSTWKSRGDAQRWCESNLGRLKQRVETVWSKRLPKKRSTSTRDEKPRIRSARCSTTISIPIYGLLLEKRQVPVIRITYAWYRSTRPYLLVCFPGVIFADRKPRKKSMKYRFGHDRQWSRFVEECLRSAVNQWKTLEDVRIWYRDSGFEFWINRLWEINIESRNS